MPEETEHSLPHAPEAASLAREHARTLAAHNQMPPDRAHAVELMVSELVTNAVRHAPPLNDGTVRLRFQQEPNALRVVVEDGGKKFSFENATFDNTTGETHLGLQMVDRLANEWGLSLDGKKAVWFQVDL